MSKTLFIGNVLPAREDANSHPEAGSKSFHITPQESAHMDLVDLPVRLEHADSLTLGTIKKSWDDESGKKWVIGELHDDSVQSKFASKDLLSSNTIFKGLSLQHVYKEYTDGTSTKHPVEVSLVREPRRGGCNITCVKAALSDKSKYLSSHGKAHEMAEPVTTGTVETNDQNKKETAETTSPSTESEEHAKTDLMKQVLGYHQANEALTDEKTKLQNELDELRKANEVRQQKQAEEQKQYIDKLASSVLEQVVSLSPEYKDQATTQAIDTLAEKYPDEVKRVLEIAHCASKRSQELESKLKSAQEDFDKRLLESKYNDVITKKHGVHVNDASETVECASAKKRKLDGSAAPNPYALSAKAPSYTLGGENNESAQQIREAYAGLRGQGSMLDCMQNVGGIIGTQRNTMGFRS
tara:strand:- start:442 stop:1674 length:1233 start_codon:yes stop_codon:yes gene_type:complete